MSANGPFPRILRAQNFHAFGLLYAMMHVARFAANAADKSFARQIITEARDPYWLPSQRQQEQMQAIERRFYGDDRRHRELPGDEALWQRLCGARA